MRRQWHLFLTAMMFFTRIPIPVKIPYGQDYLDGATRYFPLIGYLVGGICALVYFLAQQLWSPEIALLFSMVSGVLVTGAFHEDGWSDMWDGFGGGWTKDRILVIMKDSRIGAYGGIALVLLLLMKFFALRDLAPGPILWSIWTAHVLSRIMAGSVTYQYPYARAEDDPTAKPSIKRPQPVDLLFYLLFMLIPLAFAPTLAFLWIILPAFLVRTYMAWYFKRWVGGYTGDCLGAIQQATEVTVYLSILAMIALV
ncbi:adenosylcobinamide-GDP ribazoletransferase [Persicobacter psychrovividus]|uniref:Adenosylcobinamide-GDP ribazoletransferase n=2 Tax=Persicobacter psychrovividus TaxID=387638 RepID=A0ABM7VDI5_9BACT|nr:adenosylcobinamide-GDP ribazoletransferase [Persicobacter psychrovividus]